MFWHLFDRPVALRRLQIHLSSIFIECLKTLFASSNIEPFQACCNPSAVTWSNVGKWVCWRTDRIKLSACGAHKPTKFDLSYWHRKAVAKRRRWNQASSKFLETKKKGLSRSFVLNAESRFHRFCFPLDLSNEVNALPGDNRTRQTNAFMWLQMPSEYVCRLRTHPPECFRSHYIATNEVTFRHMFQRHRHTHTPCRMANVACTPDHDIRAIILTTTENIFFCFPKSA